MASVEVVYDEREEPIMAYIEIYYQCASFIIYYPGDCPLKKWRAIARGETGALHNFPVSEPYGSEEAGLYVEDDGIVSMRSAPKTGAVSGEMRVPPSALEKPLLEAIENLIGIGVQFKEE